MKEILKSIFDKRSLNICSVIIGVLFIISGLGKAIDLAGFSQLIGQYGLGYLSLLAPIIVIFEILLGLSLVLLINPKRDSIISFWMLLIFTALFAFAHFNYGVTDCGCFGAIQNTTFPPLFSFIRNFILIIMSILVWSYYPKLKTDITKWKKYIIIPIILISTFMTGLSASGPIFSSNSTPTNPETQGQNIKNTELSNYLKTSSDSTYLVFCFSYTCSYCWNSIENLRSFIRNNIVDSVLIFATGKEEDRLIFEEKFKPDFPITTLSSELMDKLTLSYPTAFYIESDTVKYVLPSELPSPFIFEKMLLSNKNK